VHILLGEQLNCIQPFSGCGASKSVETEATQPSVDKVDVSKEAPSVSAIEAASACRLFGLVIKERV
jgi:hypothetical protein